MEVMWITSAATDEVPAAGASGTAATAGEVAALPAEAVGTAGVAAGAKVAGAGAGARFAFFFFTLECERFRCEPSAQESSDSLLSPW